MGKGGGKPKVGETGDRKAGQLALESELHSMAFQELPGWGEDPRSVGRG